MRSVSVIAAVCAFTFFGGVPEVVVPDNLKSAVRQTHRYEPVITASYQQLAAHYRTAIVPARPYKPKDKAKAEVGVQIVERWIMARLRHQAFFTLAALNQAIRLLLDDLNRRPFKQRRQRHQNLRRTGQLNQTGHRRWWPAIPLQVKKCLWTASLRSALTSQWIKARWKRHGT